MLENADHNTLDEIARIACGGGDLPIYRSAPDLEKLLQQAGWSNVPRFHGESRRRWLTEQLRARRNQPDAIDSIVRRLADRREYVHRNEPLAAAEVTELLNTVLVVEGLEVTHTLGKPTIRKYADTQQNQESPDVMLHVNMTDLIRDPELAAVLEHRLAEARTCDRNGAYTSAIIMLGSLLEGVLLDALKARVPNPTKPLDKWMLNDLIELAHREHWIQADAYRFAATVRHYRNLVHPNAQVTLGDLPDQDTIKMCWPVINAALNDLAVSAVS
ncbi:hypothetical protein [Dactylosporangium sp. NPDC005555]|uniref:hypothetical protein n=1 Tax=Dactylosporangium sp. NPDC005555 TaxID=3154889 RepID=UPI0033AE573B